MIATNSIANSERSININFYDSLNKRFIASSEYAILFGLIILKYVNQRLSKYRIKLVEKNIKNA